VLPPPLPPPLPREHYSRLRCFDVSLAQYNHVLAQENPGGGLLPLAWEDVEALRRQGPGAWRSLLPPLETAAAEAGAGAAAVPDASFRGVTWYSVVVYLGDAPSSLPTHPVPILTFTTPDAGLLPHRPPSEAYRSVVRAGLVESGMSEEEADAYLAARADAPDGLPRSTEERQRGVREG
jgi:hypothetical protein